MIYIIYIILCLCFTALYFKQSDDEYFAMMCVFCTYIYDKLSKKSFNYQF